MSSKRPLRFQWLLSMAWRDSRTHRNRLLLYMSSIILGTAALVSIRSLGDNMQQMVNLEAKALLGADLEVARRQPFPPPVEEMFTSFSGDRSNQVDFTSMVLFPQNGGSRLVQVRAIEGNYPYYGTLETVPKEAAESFRSRKQALVDDGMMIQYGLAVRDSIKVGRLVFEIAGRLRKIPGETAAMSTIGPRVYIPLSYLEETGLVRTGSRVRYQAYFKFEDTVDVEALVESVRPQREQYFLDVETVESRKRSLGRSLTNLYRFLNLGGFVALILGSVGVASAIHTYVKQKLTTIAVLRCLGADARQTFLIYLIQSVSMGLVGSTIGVVIGIVILLILPQVVSNFIPFELSFAPTLLPIIQGLGIGLLMAVLFALVPLIKIRNISPLLTLRASYETASRKNHDPMQYVVYGLLVLGVTVFAISQTRFWFQGVWFSGGLILSFLLLSLVASGLMKLIKAYFPVSWGYIWRQGLANLYRPQNQTVMLILALGLGTFLVTTLYLLQISLLGHLSLTDGSNQSNMVLFDIQNDQRAPIKEIRDEFSLPVMQQVPIVTLRVASINGRTTEDIRADSSVAVSRWALRREYRCTYRDHLIDTETLVAGTWGKSVTNPGDTAYVSLESGISEDLNVEIGDEIVFDVQGIPIKAVVGNLREVNWQRVQPNFFIVFPEGVLEHAPQFHVLVTRIESTKVSAAFQRAVVLKYPNVSMIDLKLILSTVNDIMAKVSLVIRFMALFSVFTGLIVLIGVITNSRFQRIQESVLLKTLGGSRRQILNIMILEYLFLGSIAALTGVLLAMSIGWVLTTIIFEISFIPAITPVLAVILIIVMLTILVGTLAGRGINDRPPLEVLRSEI
ncbi:MAG: FtsX-like permease family protein [Gemmatimonadota bacterium]|nr:FtsX-like permease family protein [Gemmatimonadota bacterium]